jgi:hypothetical protein
MTAYSLSNLFLGRMGMAIQQGLGPHDESWSAETALYSSLVDKSLLKRVKLLALNQSLDGQDLGALSLYGQDQTGTHWLPVHQNGTSPTLSIPTPLFDSHEMKLIPQKL